MLLAVAFAATIALPVSVAVADPPPGGPPGQGECEHGNSGETCRPDPQPTHGQDCEEHGPNEGGVNEDHCLPTTDPSTTSPPTVTTTVLPTTTAPTTPPPPDTTVTTPATTTTASPTGTPPDTETQSTTSAPTTNVGGPGLEETEKPTSERSATPKLAFTGVENIVPWILAMLFLATLGSGLFWLGNRKVK